MNKRQKLLTEGVVLLHDNAQSHVFRVTHLKRAKFYWEQLDHLHYSPYMSPCDFHVFGSLKKHPKGQPLTRKMNSRALWRTRSHYDRRNSETTKYFGSLINGIVVLRPMVHTFNKAFFYIHSVISYLFIKTHPVNEFFCIWNELSAGENSFLQKSAF